MKSIGDGASILKATFLQILNSISLSYEYGNDPSLFRTKSASALAGWKALGSAVREDPLGTALPGFMEAWRMPRNASISDKAEAWGKAFVDAAMITLYSF